MLLGAGRCCEPCLLYPPSQTFQGCWGISLLGTPGYNVSLQPALPQILPPGNCELDSTCKAPRAFPFLCPSHIPYPSSPWRIPLPFCRSLSGTLTPMALGHWPSHHSQVRLLPGGCTLTGLHTGSWSQSPCSSRPGEAPHSPTCELFALSIKPLPSRLPLIYGVLGHTCPQWCGVP